MKRFYRALLSLAATLGMSPAFAGDLAEVVPQGPPPYPAVVAPPVPYLPPPRWFGPYAGLNLGFEWGNLTDLSVNPTGVIAGAQVGYNWQYGQVVFGAESDMQLSDADGTFASFQFSNPWFGTTRGRAGYAYGWTLFYATAGLAYGETKFDSAGVTDPHTSLGWTIGAGVEFAFTPCWSLKAEYLYYSLGPQTYPLAGVTSTFSSEVLRLGVNYRFSGF
jgi:outer membrane immunogenic protein